MRNIKYRKTILSCAANVAIQRNSLFSIEKKLKALIKDTKEMAEFAALQFHAEQSIGSGRRI